MVEHHRPVQTATLAVAPTISLVLLAAVAACALGLVDCLQGLLGCDPLELGSGSGAGGPASAGEFLVAALAPVASFREGRRGRRGLRRDSGSALAVLAGVVEKRDGYTELHCRRLAAFSRLLAVRLGLGQAAAEAIELGGLLHDVGKIGVPEPLLRKPGRLSSEERREMERHAALGAGIVSSIPGISKTTALCVRHHHEHWDGSGYPDRLEAQAIPLAARIVAVVDVWDALSSVRPYKKAMPQNRVIEILREHRGGKLDPELVDLFLEILDEQGPEMLNLIEADGAGQRTRALGVRPDRDLLRNPGF
jgi:HD-GYP domain-containing protein (c-di-GMP phosphodiesterase class II)